MQLTKFLLIGALFFSILGEFARYPFGTPGAVYVSDILLVGVVLTSLIWWVLIKPKIIVPKVSKFLGLFLVVSLVALLLSTTFFPPAEVIRGGLYWVRFALYSSILLVVFNLNQTLKGAKELLLEVLIRFGALLALLGFAQLLVLPNFDLLTQFGFDPHQNRLASTFLDPNFTGVYLSLTLLLIFHKFITSKSKIWLIWLGVVGLAIILTYSRSAYLTLVISALVLTIFRWRKLLIFLVIVAVLAGIFFPRFYQRVVGGLTIDQSASERLISWQNGLNVWRHWPVLGVGFNNYRYSQGQLNLLRSFQTDQSHSGGGVDSSFIFVLATTGVIGLLSYLVFWLYVWKLLIFKRTNFNIIVLAAVIGLLLGSQFTNALFYPPIMLWYLVVLGLVNE
ncbi:O-antigen ligase family protein [Candidatus Daviesbacteria bacterium]|nr:O-antigen ligase family protein [Candidatus Daviesbacteria bacterium]